MTDFTLREIKTKKSELESKVLELIKSFEEETGVKIDSFSVYRDQESDEDMMNKAVDSPDGIPLTTKANLDSDKSIANPTSIGANCRVIDVL
jgi:hypothetical protein